MHAWYCIQTKSRDERTAEINLTQQGFKTYLPLIIVKSRKEKKTIPLFPGYLFCYLDDETDDWRPINYTKGVLRLVEFGGIPAQVPQEIIETLQFDANRIMDTDYKKGDKVHLKSGALRWCEAVVHAISKDRVILLMDILGKKTRIETEYNQITLR